MRVMPGILESQTDRGVSRILIADEGDQDDNSLGGILTLAGYDVVVVSDGRDLFRKIDETHPALILLHNVKPGVNQVCAELRAAESIKSSCLGLQRWAARTPIILTHTPNISEIAKGLEAGGDDFVTKPVDDTTLLRTVRSFLETTRHRCAHSDVEGVLTQLSRAAEAKDLYAQDHIEEVAACALLLAETLGLPFSDRCLIRKGSLLHDVGKMGVDESILLKKGPLTDEERKEMMLHPIIGERMCKPLRLEKAVLQIIRHHHEHYDGSGYPDGLKGEDIPLFARIVSLANAYHAMTTPRPYRDMLLPKDALAVLREKAGRQFDPSLTSVFCDMVNIDRAR